MEKKIVLLMPLLAIVGLVNWYFLSPDEKQKEFVQLEAHQAEKIKLSRKFIDKEFENLPKVLKDARAVPHVPLGNQGKVTGFKLVSIKPGSLYEKIGLQKGDVIVSAQGSPIDTPQQAMELYQSMKKKNDLQIEIIREGKKQQLLYQIQ